jgi:hypothetical protein
MDKSGADTEDQKIIKAKEVKTIAKRQLKLQDVLKKGYAKVYSLQPVLARGGGQAQSNR